MGLLQRSRWTALPEPMDEYPCGQPHVPALLEAMKDFDFTRSWRSLMQDRPEHGGLELLKAVWFPLPSIFEHLMFYRWSP